MNKNLKAFLLLILSIPTIIHASRHALIIGANDGGPEFQKLQYAHNDAKQISEMLAQIGGFENQNITTLLTPDSARIENELSAIIERLKDDPKAKEAMFFFYYSGHADQDALKLGRTSFSLKKLRKNLDQFPSGIRIAIFDACQSGAMTRLKGGLLRRPFYLESQAKMSGQVIIASSASNERSQESDEIKGSIFSHYWMNGLRGSADLSGDRRITVNEAYQYAYAKTVEMTALTQSGIQHPTHQYSISGEGEIVLTDLSHGKTGVVIGKGPEGKFLILGNDFASVFADFYKSEKKEIFICLPPGQYKAVWIQKNGLLTGDFETDSISQAIMGVSHFKEEPLIANRIKGSIDSSYFSSTSIIKETEALACLEKYMKKISTERQRGRMKISAVLTTVGVAAIGTGLFLNQSDWSSLANSGGTIAATMGIMCFLAPSQFERMYNKYKHLPQNTIAQIRAKSYFGEKKFLEKAESEWFWGRQKKQLVLDFQAEKKAILGENLESIYGRELEILDYYDQNQKIFSRTGSNLDGSNRFGLGYKIGEAAGIGIGFSLATNFNENYQGQIQWGIGDPNGKSTYENSGNYRIVQEPIFENNFRLLGRSYRGPLFAELGVGLASGELEKHVADSLGQPLPWRGRLTESELSYVANAPIIDDPPSSYRLLRIPLQLGLESGRRYHLFFNAAIGTNFVYIFSDHALENLKDSHSQLFGSQKMGFQMIGSASVGYYFF